MLVFFLVYLLHVRHEMAIWLSTFFAHENQAAPPSLSENGLLRLSKKKPKIQIQAVYINMLIPATGKRFRDYAIHTLVPYIKNISSNVNRVDIVWDRYFEDSLKSCTRGQRGAGIRRKFTSNGILPGNWATFLQCSENKAELFPFLSNMVVLEMSHKLVVATNNDEVASNEEIDFTTLMPSNIEEADGRIFVLVMHAATNNSLILIKTVDSDGRL